MVYGIEDTLRRNKAKYHQSCQLIFDNTKLERARKRISSTNNQPDQGHIKIRRTRESWCFLCEKESPATEIRQAMTMLLNERVKNCARLLNVGRLLEKTKWSGCCGTRAEVSPHMFDWPLQQREGLPDIHWGGVQARKITERKSLSTDIFRADCLHNRDLKKWRPNGLGAPDVNSTRLKEQILAEMPEIEAFKKGRDVTIAFRKDVWPALSQSCRNFEAITQGLAEAYAWPQIYIWWNILERMYSRCHTINSSSVCGHDWTWGRHKIPTEVGCIKVRPGNVAAAIVQLLCKIRRRNSYPPTFKRTGDTIPSLHGHVCPYQNQKETSGRNVTRPYH